jgi:hypothetical protein
MRGIPDELLPSMSIFLRNNLAHILRDAEIAEAAREYAKLYNEQGMDRRSGVWEAQLALFDLVTKETP